jgi:hypothetical protein
VGRQSTTILDDPRPVEVLHDGAWGAGLADRLPARRGRLAGVRAVQLRAGMQYVQWRPAEQIRRQAPPWQP